MTVAAAGEIAHVGHLAISAGGLAHVGEHLRFRLIERALAVVRPLEPGLADLLDGQIQPERLAVDREPDVARQRCVHAGLAEQLIAEIVLHIGRVGVDVVEIQLVQPVVGLALDELAEVELEAVAVAVLVACHGGQAGVALRGEGHVVDRFAVDRDADLVFRLVQRVFPQVRPVGLGDRDVDRVDVAAVKERVGVVRRGVLGRGLFGGRLLCRRLRRRRLRGLGRTLLRLRLLRRRLLGISLLRCCAAAGEQRRQQGEHGQNRCEFRRFHG